MDKLMILKSQVYHLRVSQIAFYANFLGTQRDFAFAISLLAQRK